MFAEEFYECANPFFVLAFDEFIGTFVEMLDQEAIELHLSGIAFGVVVNKVDKFFGFDGCLVLREELAEFFGLETVDNILKIEVGV